MKISRTAILIAITLFVYGCSNQDSVVPEIPDVDTNGPVSAEFPVIDWVSSLDLGIAISSSHSDEIVSLTSGSQDYKPTFSPDGNQVAFFRIVESRSSAPEDWDTKICVINTDGTGYKELTSGEFTDWNPMWTRDGTNRIIFTRFIQRGPYTTRVYWVDPSGEHQEELISDDQYSEFAYSGLSDGRILVRRIQDVRANSYLLLTPDEDQSQYELLDYPDIFLHKMSVSPSEDKITYMKVEAGPGIYTDAVLAFADFDSRELTISNEIEFTSHNASNIAWYPCWNPEESHIIYSLISNVNSGNGQIMAYDLDAGLTQRISRYTGRSYWYPNVRDVVK